MAKNHRQPPEPKGIYGADRHRWRNSILYLALDGEAPFFARLRETYVDHVELEVLDPKDLKSVTAQRFLPWPPPGEVRVHRTAL